MNPKEALLWSIALPGFGQILNGKYVKGFLFIFLEVVVNVQANFNQIIVFSFLGEIDKAILHTNYQWLMFYPCVYFFAMWDAFKDAGGGKDKYASVPFVFCAYFVTVGLIFSYRMEIFGFLLGPMWLPILFVIPGLIVGVVVKKLLQKKAGF
ncbi:TM2 domain-containing membrane protein YozV [Evansella vedderi]|uniref:TM2 domain-containing membrane protein YozV n=1 Tax=Evansella vedderi TaxID=38282 RepID=A0ABU0A255_9BACI|nr:hypothetical protein [Evansella vedderi]MDQ0257315.1 TM2 domain-containing membrane protein YozV [Evansella vedderi]